MPVPVLPEASKILQQLAEAKDHEIVMVTRKILRDLVERVLIAQGHTIESARIHAEINISEYIFQARP